jgi:hypothetical protein
MNALDDRLRVYKELADWYDRQRQPQMRDRFLLLAADVAHAAGRGQEAERLRQRLLQVNPHHLLKPYGSFGEATRAPDVAAYLKNLRSDYPLHVAEELLSMQKHGRQPGASPSPMLPPTAPVIDFDEPPSAFLRGAAEDSGEIYRVGATEQPNLDATAAPGPRGAPVGSWRRLDPSPAARPPASAPGPPAAPPRAFQPRRASAAPFAAEEPVVPEGSTAGGWLGSFLCVVISLAGAAWFAFTFLRPYLPANWLR